MKWSLDGHLVGCHLDMHLFMHVLLYCPEMEADFSRKRLEEEAKFAEDREKHEKQQVANAKFIEKQLAEAEARAKAVAKIDTPNNKTLTRTLHSPSPGSMTADTAEANYAGKATCVQQ